MSSGRFQISKVTVTENGYRYTTYRLRGRFAGLYIRKQFKSEDEAHGAKNRYEVLAANAQSDVRTVNTRLSVDQLIQAEAAFTRLGNAHTLSAAVDWFLANYRPPVVAKPLADAAVDFRAARKPHVSFYVARDYKRELRNLQEAFSTCDVHATAMEKVQAYMEARKLGPKSWNNLRGHADLPWWWRETSGPKFP